MADDEGGVRAWSIGPEKRPDKGNTLAVYADVAAAGHVVEESYPLREMSLNAATLILTFPPWGKGLPQALHLHLYAKSFV